MVTSWAKTFMISFKDIFGSVRKLLSPPYYSVSWDEFGITLGQLLFYYYPRKWFVSWEKIVTVYGRKIDMIGYEENHLIFEDGSEKWFSVGELDKGFPAFEQEIFRRYPDIRRGWMGELEMNPAGIDFLLWPRFREPDVGRVPSRPMRSRRLASRMRRRTHG